MKKYRIQSLVAVLGASAILAGCVAVPYDRPPPPRGHHGYYGHGDRDRDGARHRRDRDRDGVPDRYDRRPNDPRRY